MEGGGGGVNSARGPFSFFPGEKVFRFFREASFHRFSRYIRARPRAREEREGGEGERGERMSRTEGTSSPRLRAAVSAALRVVISLCSPAIR